MATANNNKEFSRLATPAGGAIDEIKDASDNVHTGIVKALSKLASGNIPVKGFNITGSSLSSLTFATGDTLVDGVKQTVGSGLTVTIDSSNTNRYTLIVANGTSLVARTHSVDNAIPASEEDDVIIGVANYTGSDPPLFQYLTVSKDSNTVSIARDNSGYTESATIKSNSGDIEFEALEQDKDIIFKVNDGGSSTEVMRIDGDVSRVGIGTNAPDSTLHIRGSSNPTVRIQEDSQTGYLDLSGLQDSQASIAAVNDTASEVSILDITAKCNSSTGTGQEVRVFRDARTNADGTFALKQPGTNTNAFKFQCDKDGTDHEFIADGDVKIGGTSSPAVALDVTGEFRLSSHAELNGDLNHDGSNVGFFGTAVAAQQSVGNLAATTIGPLPFDPLASQIFSTQQQTYLLTLENEINGLRTKVDALVDALQLYGLIT